MKTTVFSALAVCAASSLAFANESEDWPTLDREIESLASSLSQGGSGVAVSAFVKATYNSSGDIGSGPMVGVPAAQNDWGGFVLNNARINFDGSVGDYGVHIGIDVGGGTGMTALGNYNHANTLLPAGEAYATFSLTDQISGQLGLFRSPMLGDSLRDEDQLLFINRTFNGDFWANMVGRDGGAQFSGAFDQVNFWIAFQNGLDVGGDELAMSGRVEFNALGTGSSSSEGAYGADEGSSLTVAAGFYRDEDSVSTPLDIEAFCFEADYTMGALYVGATMVDMSDGIGGLVETLVDPLGTTAGTTGDSTPWDLTVSYMVVEDTYEVAGRYEVLDDNDDTTIMTLGLNRYVEGHDAKWQVQYSTMETDALNATGGDGDIDVISLGLLVSV